MWDFRHRQYSVPFRIKFLNIIISKNNCKLVRERIICTSDPEALVDQLSDLSSAKETVVFWSFWFLQTNLSLEKGTMEDSVQCWSHLRIEYFKIWHSNSSYRWRRLWIIHWINQLHLFALVFCGLLTGSPDQLLMRTQERTPSRIAGLGTARFMAHPFPATPCQWPRSRTATLGEWAAAHFPALTLAWLYIEPSPCGGVRPAGDQSIAHPEQSSRTIPTLDRTLVAR